MKQIKYIFNGGLPLSQNVLDWQQTGYKEVFAAIGKLGWSGGDPVIMTGCEDAGAGVYNDGWIFDGTEHYYFQGGDSVAAGTTNIKLQEITTTVVFESGASQAIYSRKEYVFDNTGTIAIEDLLLFHKVFGEKTFGLDVANGSGTLNISGGTGNLSGQILMSKYLLTPQMRVRGAIIVQTPSALSDPPVYQTLGNVASADFHPAFNVHFKANIEGYILETGGVLRFNDVNMRYTTAGNFDVQLIKPDAGVANYTITFNTIIPLI